MSGINRKTRRLWLRWSWTVAGLMIFFAGPVFSQRTTSIPSPSHYDSYRMIYQGNIGGAARLCRAELAGATRIGSQRWIDSVCYYALLGETYYLSGDLSSALESYEAAIDLYLSYRDWLSRVVYPTGITSAAPPTAPWGPSGRNVPIGIFPRSALIRIGDPITEERLQQGGIMKNPEMRKIEPDEILRCVTLAMRRRNEILGPLAPSDPRCRQILECFSTRSVTPNHWSVVLLDVLFGIALEGAGKNEEAINILCGSLLMSGQCDHFLTASALLTLGDIYLKNGKPLEAADSYYEASISAFAYGDYLLVEEALRKFAGADRVRNDRTTEFPYALAAQWASDQVKSPFLFLSLTLGGAEFWVDRGRLDEAENGLRPMIGLLKSQGLDRSRYADLYYYLSAILFFHHGKIEAGNEALAAMTAGVTEHSSRFFQIGRLNAVIGDLTPRTATDLYERLLRPSDFYDWAGDAPTAFTIESTPLEREFGNWFLLLMNRDLKEKAFDAAERIRTRRFLNSFEMGGRLFSLRYLLESPIGGLSEENRVLRQNILLDHPDYGEWSKKASEISKRLAGLPILPDESERGREQALLTELQNISREQEKILRRIAIGRFPLPELFPPLSDSRTIRERLPEKTSILSFLDINNEFYAFLATGEILDGWRVGSVGPVTQSVAAFLISCGATDANKAKLSKEILSEAWKGNGQKLLTALLGNPTADDPRSSVQFEKLAIVPDGVLWYCPFDALSLPKGDGLIPLAAVPGLTLEYAPTVSLTFSERPTSKQDFLSETVVVPGKLHPKEDGDRQFEAIARLDGILQKPVLLSAGKTDAPNSLLASRIERLLVLHEIPSDGGDWVPFVSDEKSRGEPISTWPLLPWNGPKLAVFSGFRSAAENGLKDGGNGSEFFIPLLILESQGAETILISRWRSGGRSTYDLTETFFENLRKDLPTDAWKTAVTKVISSPLELREEPRFKGTIPKPVPNGEHPFFWGGFMLVHRGILPLQEDGTIGTPESANGSADGVTEDDPGEGFASLPDSNEAADNESAESEGMEEGQTTPKTESALVSSDRINGEEEDEASSNPEDASKTKKNRAAKRDQKDKKSDETAKENETKSKPKPASSSPVTDEDIEEADRNADDFYAPEK